MRSMKSELVYMAMGFLYLVSFNAWSADVNDLDCLLEPNMEVKVSSPVSGILDKVKVERGDRVRKGSVILTLKSSVEKASVDLARARADFAGRKAERNEDLYKQDLISIHEKDELVTEARIAEMELKEAVETLKLRTMRSPITGVIVERNSSPGEYVGVDSILTIASIDPLNVEVIVPVERLGEVKKGAIADIYPGEPIGGRYQAKVIIVDEVIDAASGTFGVRLELPNPGHKIPAGLKCKVRFSTQESVSINKK